MRKVCGKCGELKWLTEFYSDRARSDGKMWMCKVCARQQKIDMADYYKKYRQEHKEYFRKKYKEYKERQRLKQG